MGGFQPARLVAVVKDAQGEGADGLLSRFQPSVWPDPVRDRSTVDRAPDRGAAERIRALFERTYSAVRNRPASQPLRFDPEAQHRFDRWSGPWLLAAAARPAALQSHFVKMQRTIAGLSLSFEYMTGPSERVSVQAVDMALSWAPFLSAHAERIHSISSTSLPAASAILARRTALPHRFSARDIYRADWSGLDVRPPRPDWQTLSRAGSCGAKQSRPAAVQAGNISGSTYTDPAIDPEGRPDVGPEAGDWTQRPGNPGRAEWSAIVRVAPLRVIGRCI